MGLFDKVLGGPQELNGAEGVVGIVVSAVAADGVITPEEVQGLGTGLSRMKLFRSTNARELQKMFEKVVKIAKEEGVESLITRSAKAVPADLKPTAFTIAADLLFADGDVSSSERKYLERIQHALGVHDDLALKVVDVLAVKNKG